jgi:hypothetical protein
VEAGAPVCDCNDGFVPSGPEPLNCVPDLRDGGGPDDGRDDGGEGGGEAAEGADGDVGDGSGDDGAETGPVCGNGVRETGEACERGDYRDCEMCGKEYCNTDCRDYGSCTEQGRCDPATDPGWNSGDCGRTECVDGCYYVLRCETTPESCTVVQTSFCGYCGAAPCFQDCPGRRQCTAESYECNWGGCILTGDPCGAYRCTYDP